jgi:hypothetical protein
MKRKPIYIISLKLILIGDIWESNFTFPYYPTYEDLEEVILGVKIYIAPIKNKKGTHVRRGEKKGKKQKKKKKKKERRRLRITLYL